jgi:hypothetical protein
MSFKHRYDYLSNGSKPQMLFHQLDLFTQIEYTRREFVSLVKTVFEAPEIMRQWLLDKKLSNEQAKEILIATDKMAMGACFCCKRFDQYRLKLTPIEPSLEPLLDIARQSVKAKLY